jgi:IS30 family transposase
LGINYSHFTEHNRIQIEVMLGLDWNFSRIARELGRDRSSVLREVRRGTVPPFRRYTAQAGQRSYWLGRRRNGLSRRRLGHDLSCPAWQPIIGALRAGWSPEQYCGRIRMLDALIGFRGPAASLISHETIYKAIFKLPFSPERHDLTCLLRNSLAGRRHRRRRGSSRRSSSLQNITPISQRPLDVLSRLVPGHWEGDLIKGADGKSFVGTLVERTTRLTLLVKLRNATAGEVYRAFLRRLAAISPALRLSLTYDRGSEMALHSRLSKRLNMPVYFCDPYCPWQRPTNENTNGLVRQYLPKGLDLNLISHSQLAVIESALNNRPRRVLGFRTSFEAFQAAAAIAA